MVNALAVVPGDATGLVRPALFAGGSFEFADGKPAMNLARWSVTPARPLALTDHNGPGSLRVSLNWCAPGANYFTAFSTDPLNATAPASGPWGGMHVSLVDLLTQFLTNSPPTVGTLTSVGDAGYFVQAGTLSAPSGTTLWAVSHLYDPATLTTSFATPVAVYGL
jgi:hypothetical protein